MAQEEEELDREIAAADRQQRERDASRILSAADEILRAGEEFAGRSPVSTGVNGTDSIATTFAILCVGFPDAWAH